MSKNEKSKARIFANNAYAVKTVWSISKSRVIHTAVYTALGYVEWVFMSIFFLRYVINAIETQAPFGTIMMYIGICFLVFCLRAMYNSFMPTVVVPFTDNKIYRSLYRNCKSHEKQYETFFRHLSQNAGNKPLC